MWLSLCSGVFFLRTSSAQQDCPSNPKHSLHFPKRSLQIPVQKEFLTENHQWFFCQDIFQMAGM
jgi:hypothetical protein